MSLPTWTEKALISGILTVTAIVYGILLLVVSGIFISAELN